MLFKKKQPLGRKTTPLKEKKILKKKTTFFKKENKTFKKKSNFEKENKSQTNPLEKNFFSFQKNELLKKKNILL